MGKREKGMGKVNNYRWKSKNFWKPGDELTESDQKMLELVQRFYERHGYTPTRKEVANDAALKQRFRVWDDAMVAAGLPRRNDPENTRKRQEALDWQKRVLGEEITE